jgi:hypothetical protein
MTLKAKRDRFESYEVFDDHGNSVGRVILPRQQRFFGSTRGTIYLNRQPRVKSTTGPRAA